MTTKIVTTCDRCGATADHLVGQVDFLAPPIPARWYKLTASQALPNRDMPGSTLERTGTWYLCPTCGAEQWPAGGTA